MAQLWQNNLIMYPKALFRISVVILNNIYCIPTYVVWMTLLLPVKHYNPNLYYKVEGLFFHWLLSLVAMWSYTAGYDVVELGDDIAPCRQKNSKTLVIANHQSTADVPLMMTCFNAKQDILPNIMWIMERLFKYTNFGIVSLIHQDFFISSGRENREQSIRSLKDHINQSFIPRMRNWMVLFPEGGFLHKRKAISKRYAAKNNLPDLENVSLPRVGALKAIFSVLAPHSQPEVTASNNNSKIETSALPTQPLTNGSVQELMADEKQAIASDNLDYILDITIGYPQGKPLDLPCIVHGMRDPFKTHFLYRLYHTSQVPKEEEALTAWLFERWQEKEKLLAGFYKTGSFQIPSAITPMTVEQDMLRFVIINLFFMTSTYLHVQMFYALFAGCNSLYLYSFM